MRCFLVCTFLLFSLPFSFALSAEELEKSAELPQWDRMDFPAFYQKALENSVAITESKGQLGVSESRLQLANALRLPQINAQVLAGPSPSFSGDALNSSVDYSSWGVATSAQVELIQPLYTFGAISKLRAAAQAAQEAEEGRHNREELTIAQEIAKLYYGYQLAFELRELSRDLLEQLRGALEEGQKLRKQKKKGAPSLTDLERLNVYIAELTARFEEAQKFMDLAKLGMAVEVGSYGAAQIRWRRASLKRPDFVLKDLDHYVELAKSQRPEHKALQKEVEARRLFWEASQSQRWPQIFAGARYNYAFSNVSEDQPSRFASDEFNQHSGAVGVGLRWQLFSPVQAAKVAEARAEYLKTEGKNRILDRSLQAEVEKNWRELRFLQGAAEQRELAEQSARRVFLDMYSGFALGTQKAKDLLEALALWAQMKKSRLDIVYEERLAVVRLQASLGKVGEEN